MRTKHDNYHSKTGLRSLRCMMALLMVVLMLWGVSSNTYAANAANIGGDIYSQMLAEGTKVADLPLVPATSLAWWSTSNQLEYLRLHGENPSLATLARFDIKTVYDWRGNEVAINSASFAQPGINLYADRYGTQRYVYYGGTLFLLNRERTIYTTIAKPVRTNADLFDLTTMSNSGQGFMVENQHHDLIRTRDTQYCGLLHFTDEYGRKVLNDLYVYFEPGDKVEVTLPQSDTFHSTARSVWAWQPFETTIVYTRVDRQQPPPVPTASICVPASDLCVRYQPDGFPV